MGTNIHVEFLLDTDCESYKACSSMEDCDNHLMFLSEQFNSFLKQASYPFNNDYILMESLTNDEYCLLEEYLKNIRAGKGGS